MEHHSQYHILGVFVTLTFLFVFAYLTFVTTTIGGSAPHHRTTTTLLRRQLKNLPDPKSIEQKGLDVDPHQSQWEMALRAQLGSLKGLMDLGNEWQLGSEQLNEELTEGKGDDAGLNEKPPPPPEPYPLRDVSHMPRKIEVTKWFAEVFDDPVKMNCMDFRCTHDASLCDNVLETDYDNPPGPNGPCCTHVLRDMLRVFDESMAQMGLDYFLGFGTLLGTVRYGRVIPWTLDNDIVIQKPIMRLMTELWDVEASGLAFVSPKIGKSKKGAPRMCVTPQFASGKIQKWQVPTNSDIAFTDRGFPYFNLYHGEDLGHGTWGHEHEGCLHYDIDVFPTKRQWVYDGTLALNFPAKPELLVQRYYGSDWRVPLKEESENDRYRQICSTLYLEE
mmetsp:Transcript_7212/g.13455  ORF Transcript_7212/g.13455 Transcript_7212/m.13455 type:complete len:389 (-) Transcript_7212:357-1523(-)